MIEPVCRYLSILALLVRIALSFYSGRGSSTGTMATGAPPTIGEDRRQDRSRGTCSPPASVFLFVNIWTVIALTFWLTALVQE